MSFFSFFFPLSVFLCSSVTVFLLTFIVCPPHVSLSTSSYFYLPNFSFSFYLFSLSLFLSFSVLLTSLLIYLYLYIHLFLLCILFLQQFPSFLYYCLFQVLSYEVLANSCSSELFSTSLSIFNFLTFFVLSVLLSVCRSLSPFFSLSPSLPPTPTPFFHPHTDPSHRIPLHLRGGSLTENFDFCEFDSIAFLIPSFTRIRRDATNKSHDNLFVGFFFFIIFFIFWPDPGLFLFIKAGISLTCTARVIMVNNITQIILTI